MELEKPHRILIVGSLLIDDVITVRNMKQRMKGCGLGGFVCGIKLCINGGRLAGYLSPYTHTKGKGIRGLQGVFCES